MCENQLCNSLHVEILKLKIPARGEDGAVSYLLPPPCDSRVNHTDGVQSSYQHSLAAAARGLSCAACALPNAACYLHARDWDYTPRAALRKSNNTAFLPRLALRCVGHFIHINHAVLPVAVYFRAPAHSPFPALPSSTRRASLAHEHPTH
jgi:hypothetical protein